MVVGTEHAAKPGSSCGTSARQASKQLYSTSQTMKTRQENSDAPHPEHPVRAGFTTHQAAVLQKAVMLAATKPASQQAASMRNNWWGNMSVCGGADWCEGFHTRVVNSGKSEEQHALGYTSFRLLAYSS